MQRTDALVIGAGPAGLMAASEIAAAGHSVVVAEAKPSIGRKFLMAGKSGLNLTKDEEIERFLQAYGDSAHVMDPMLRAFGPKQVCAWAEALGQPVFTGSSGRVFPKTMKASPLLRAWASELAGAGAEISTRWRWTGWDGDAATFDTPDGDRSVAASRTLLALGGASWARLGSDGQWAGILAERGVDLVPFKPANVGLRVNWSEHMIRHFGTPVKGIALLAGGASVRAECVVSQKGLEGGGIYAVSALVRDGAELFFDLLPDRSADWITERLSRPRGKQSRSNHLRKALRLDSVKQALLMEFAAPLPADPHALAGQVKSLRIRHAGPRPMDEAISTAGGVAWDAVNEALELRALPAVHVAGEMLDWEAPTGGYLLTGCLATGRHAGRRMAEALSSVA